MGAVGVSALTGATGVGLVSKISKLGKVGKIAIEATIDVAGSAGTQLAKDGKVDLLDVAIDVVGGQTVGKFAEKKFLKSGKGKHLQSEVNKQKNAAQGKSNTISKATADPQGAQNKLNEAAAVRGITIGTATSGGASTAKDALKEKVGKDEK